MVRPHTSWAVAALFLFACVDPDKSTNSTVPGVVVRSVAQTQAMTTGAWVNIGTSDADSARVAYASADRSDTGSTPWFSASAGQIPVLGLLPNTHYQLTPMVLSAGAIVSGNSVSYLTNPLPAALQGEQFQFTIGRTFSRGFNLVAVQPRTFDTFVILLDSLGVIRWYRDVGFNPGYETKQQPDGHFTVFLGQAGPPAGTYVELTPTGDSVRAVMARGSPFTDCHELVSTYAPGGTLLADYLFGYDMRSGDIAHQILRVHAGGRVDTLVQGWSQWSAADQIEPGSGNDRDHPNALTFDLDGGIVVSYRSLSSVVKLDSSGAIQWILGGTHNQFTFIGDSLGGFDGQHDVRILPNGHVMMFDNGWLHLAQGSRAVEYQLDLAQKTATMVWQYVPSPVISVPFTGSAQRLSNGNTLVAFTTPNILDEVAPDATLLARAQLGGPAPIFYRVTRVARLYSYQVP